MLTTQTNILKTQKIRNEAKKIANVRRAAGRLDARHNAAC